ncbi:MFS transporter [Auritidibacter sp. NML100628]|uniref:MFS transporter n=1 Tax=Auritidibacter sp. NML100628 TaxID=2170742 RepID=UPI000D732912|nr:MFS transporter [Auritidibacter sp. NML100628]PXA76987.1 hypothetical protein DCC24_05135 [Auritidibacter sp. NML100628]
MASLITYAMLGWMPTLLEALSGDAGTASIGYSIFTFMTLPPALVVPWLAQRVNRTGWIMWILVLVPIAGFIGLILFPQLPLVWSVLIGMIGGAFPLAIAHFNLRTSTTSGSSAISGFAMSVGYLFGTLGPLLGGWLSTATGTWNVPLIVYAIAGAVMLVGGLMMTKPGRTLEDARKDTSSAT